MDIESALLYMQHTALFQRNFPGGMHYTTTGGKDSLSWNYIQVNSDHAWFAGNIDAQPNGNVYTTGIHFAHSTNFGLTAGQIQIQLTISFDGGVDFLDNNIQRLDRWGTNELVRFSGWIHRTTDGGATWSPQT